MNYQENKFEKKLAITSKKEFNSELVYNEKYLKTKKKPCRRKISTNFHKNKIPKEGCQCIRLSVILIDSVYRKENLLSSSVF